MKFEFFFFSTWIVPTSSCASVARNKPVTVAPVRSHFAMYVFTSLFDILFLILRVSNSELLYMFSCSISVATAFQNLNALAF